MALYDAFRKNFGPTQYPENKTAWAADVVEAGLLYCILAVLLSFLLVLPGIREKNRFFSFSIRIFVSLYIGTVILLSNFAMTWEVSHIHTHTKYKAGSGKEISADIYVNIGLRGINVTLKGTPVKQLNETIDYNEDFDWRWRQGRFGFGPFAGRFNREYRAAQFRGLPLPILWIADYFTYDGEGLRWGRHYRQAGWYTHIMLWLALPLWILSNVMFLVLLRYGAYFLILTGGSMVTANVIYASIRNLNDLVIPFTDENILRFHFGLSFYICLATGSVCIILGIIIIFMDLRYPIELSTFFNVDVLQDIEEIQVIDEVPQVMVSAPQNDDDGGGPDTTESEPEAVVIENEEEQDAIYDVQPVQFKSRSTRLTKRFQKSRRKPTSLLPSCSSSDHAYVPLSVLSSAEPSPTPTKAALPEPINEEREMEELENFYENTLVFQPPKKKGKGKRVKIQIA